MILYRKSIVDIDNCGPCRNYQLVFFYGYQLVVIDCFKKKKKTSYYLIQNKDLAITVTKIIWVWFFISKMFAKASFFMAGVFAKTIATSIMHAWNTGSNIVVVAYFQIRPIHCIGRALRWRPSHSSRTSSTILTNHFL